MDDIRPRLKIDELDDGNVALITPSPYINELLGRNVFSRDTKYRFDIASPTNYKCTYRIDLDEYTASIVICHGFVVIFRATIYYENIDKYLFTRIEDKLVDQAPMAKTKMYIYSHGTDNVGIEVNYYSEYGIIYHLIIYVDGAPGHTIFLRTLKYYDDESQIGEYTSLVNETLSRLRYNFTMIENWYIPSPIYFEDSLCQTQNVEYELEKAISIIESRAVKRII